MHNDEDTSADGWKPTDGAAERLRLLDEASARLGRMFWCTAHDRPVPYHLCTCDTGE